MPRSKSFRPLCLLLAAGSFFAGYAAAQTTSPGPDFSGIWQLNDRASDSAAVITQRLHAERRREQAPSSQPANAGSSATPASSSNGFGGRGGHGMGGGGHGMGGGQHGNHDYQDSSRSSSNATPKDPTPPLFADDALLNVQQSRQGMRVDFNNNDRLDTQFDNIARQSLNSTARVQTQLTQDGMHVSMDFGNGTRLEQAWVRSADGHHLTVTETWTTAELKEPIVFTRSYDRLDM